MPKALGGSEGMFPQETFEKRHALRSILMHFWPCITCISVSGLIYGGVSRGGAQGAQAPPSSSRSSMLNEYCMYIS